MKTLTPIILTLLLASSSLLAQRQTPPTARKIGQVLADFRIDRSSKPVRIYASTERMVLSKMFRKYLTDDSKCNRNFQGRGDDPLKAARSAGQIVPSISDSATGSFTAAGQTQTLYVVAVNECNASHADNFGTKRVAIFSGSQMVADVDVDFKSGIVRKTDLNGDGIDELLMTSGDMAQGTLVEMADLIDFQNGRMHVIEDLGTVIEDSCGTGMQDSSSKASVISVVNSAPGTMPKLKIDNYEARCSKNRRWKFVSTGKQQ